MTATRTSRHHPGAIAPTTNGEPGSGAPRLFRVRRAALTVATALISINVWTGSPLLALWIGSRLVPQSRLSMAAIFVVVAVLAVLSLAAVLALTWLSARYDELTGRPVEERRTSPWLRSLRGEREESRHKRLGISPLERIVVLVVIAAVIAFEIWFFFFAGPSIYGQAGLSQ